MIMARRADHWEIAELTGQGVRLTSPGAKSTESHHPTHLLRDNLKPWEFQILFWATDVFVRQKYCTFSRALFMNLPAFLFLKVLISKKTSFLFTLEWSSTFAACSIGGGGWCACMCVCWEMEGLQKSPNHNARVTHT